MSKGMEDGNALINGVNEMDFDERKVNCQHHSRNNMNGEDNFVNRFRQWKSPNTPSLCTYHQSNSKAESPHTHLPIQPKKPDIMDTILDNIGHTPLVKLNKIPTEEGLQCDILVKCEFFNAGGSIKDRIGVRMIEDAERMGVLKPGDVLIEPTSGNTGISIALASAVKGYRCIIVLPEKMSREKVDVMRALGAEIIRTPTGAAFDSEDSHIGVARRLLEEIPNSHILDQLRNSSNPLAHYDGTAEEILKACRDQVDMVVASSGTGGTLTGIARKFKERCPNCKVIGVDPEGSIHAFPDSLNETSITRYEIEGIGYDFRPTVLDRKIVDKWYKSIDKPSFLMARRLIREEGLLCGGSSGANMYCAIQAAKDFGLQKGQRCVVILPDSIRNYMTKFLSDDWMTQKSFLELPEPQTWWWNVPVSAMNLRAPCTVTPDTTIEETVAIMNTEKNDHVPVIDQQGVIMGVVNISDLMGELVKTPVPILDPVSTVMCKQYKLIQMESSLGELSRLLENDSYVFIAQSQRNLPGIAGVATRIDLVNFITQKSVNHTDTPVNG